MPALIESYSIKGIQIDDLREQVFVTISQRGIEIIKY